MRENDNKFDLQVKSLMEEAREDVPAGAWSAINARLRRKESFLLWFRRAGIAVSAVAVLSLGLILYGTFRKAPEKIMAAGQPELLADIPSTADTRKDVPDSNPEPASAIDAPVYTPSMTSAGSRVADEAVSAIEPSSEEMSVEQADHREFNQNDDASVSNGKVPQYNGPSENGSLVLPDSFRSDSDRPSFPVSGRRVSLDVKGLLGSNDNIRPSFDHAAAPSDKVDGTFIQEFGDSQYEIPVSFGLGIRAYLNDRISIGTGIDYTLYNRTFSGFVDKISNNDIRHSIHYIGIPVTFFYDFIKNDKIKIYGFIGGSAQKAIINKYRIGKGSESDTRTLKVNGIQFSSDFGAGIQYQLGKNAGIYLDPSATYYFDCKQPHSIITEKPFQFNFEIGLRFNL